RSFDRGRDGLRWTIEFETISDLTVVGLYVGPVVPWPALFIGPGALIVGYLLALRRDITKPTRQPPLITWLHKLLLTLAVVVFELAKVVFALVLLAVDLLLCAWFVNLVTPMWVPVVAVLDGSATAVHMLVAAAFVQWLHWNWNTD
ncbi:MAG: hypothetical protein ACR2RB_20660, partial [Gammaproteobacteria bacterium]